MRSNFETTEYLVKILPHCLIIKLNAILTRNEGISFIWNIVHSFNVNYQQRCGIRDAMINAEAARLVSNYLVVFGRMWMCKEFFKPAVEFEVLSSAGNSGM